MSKIMSGHRGQVLPYFLIMTLMLVLSWAMMINTAKLLRDRMALQNAADNAALSVAVYKARLYNALGVLNHAISDLLFGPEIFGISGFLSYYERVVTIESSVLPFGAALPLFPEGGIPPGYDPVGRYAFDSQENVACLPDISSSNGLNYVKAVSKAVNILSTLQDKLMKSYRFHCPILASAVARRQEINSRGEQTGADGADISAGLSPGLARNQNGITYYRTEKTETKDTLAIKLCAAFLSTILGIPIKIKDIYSARRWKKEKYSWVYAEREQFFKEQQVKVIAFKSGNSRSNRGYPIFGRWIGITWPDMQAYGTARTYNTCGPVFPIEQRGKPSDSISPVLREYKKTQKGGWDAHFVP